VTPVTIIIDSPARRDRAVAWLGKIPCDEVLELALRPYKPTRSEKQNARYWLLLTKISEHTGHDKDELHEMMKARFLGSFEKEIAGEKITAIKSSARLKVKEFLEYSERVEHWAVETLGVWLE
jgi:hypothetical protein